MEPSGPADPFESDFDDGEYFAALQPACSPSEAAARLGVPGRDGNDVVAGLSEAEAKAAILQALHGTDTSMSDHMLSRVLTELGQVKMWASLWKLWSAGLLHVGLDDDGQLAFRSVV